MIDNIDNGQKNLIDEAFNVNLEVKIAKGEFLPFLQDILKKAGMGAMLFAGSDYDYNLSSQVASALDKRVGFFTQKINETTFKKLQREMVESLAEGESRRQLINRIQDVYGNISKARAGVIARTEISVANNEGIYDGYRQAGMPTKMWVWAVGVKGGVRDDHLAMDGEEVPFNQPFSNGLMKPNEFNAPAEEIVNCQCIMA